MSAEKIFEGVYLVGSSDLTDGQDCCVYLIEFENELVLIDSGAGESVPEIISNINSLKLGTKHLKRLILTHCHIDHIGGANEFKSKCGLAIIAHEKCAEIVLRADPVMTAAKWYGMTPDPVVVNQTFSEPEFLLDFGKETLHLIHIPGHSPDSIAVYLDRGGMRILFGQDVHGPIHPALGSNLAQYKESLQKLIDLKADILCEGHFGTYQPKAAVEKYIRGYL
jgi:glyoxylase-like metal-dependent hydrolase (beta-lactamase superfamily II)